MRRLWRPSARRRRPGSVVGRVFRSDAACKQLLLSSVLVLHVLQLHYVVVPLTAKSLGTSCFTKLTYPVSPGHLPFLSLLYSSHELTSFRDVLDAKRGAGAKAAVKATRATKRRMTLANMVLVYGLGMNMASSVFPQCSIIRYFGIVAVGVPGFSIHMKL